jgi:hypothetical protein
MAFDRLTHHVIPSLEEYLVFTSAHEPISATMILVSKVYSDLLETMIAAILLQYRDGCLDTETFERLQRILSIHKQETRIRERYHSNRIDPTWPQFAELELEASRNPRGVMLNLPAIRDETAKLRSSIKDMVQHG